jgi:HEAT repeat protein
MDAFSQNPPGQGGQAADPRLQPTPDYGTLGPGSDIPAGTPAATTSRPAARSGRSAPIIAIAAGGLLAALVAGAGSARRSLTHTTNKFSSANSPVVSSAKDLRQLNQMRPEKQAEVLLQLAVANSDEAREQIFARVGGWRGKLKWSQLAPLFAAALNAKDLRVREAGIEVELAAYGLAKNPAAVDSLALEAESSDHAQKIWALWALGLMANRGVDADRVVEILTGHLKDSDVDSRRWAVESLALVGTTPTIAPLLQTMHDDPSPLVRERAACSLAESGMLTRELRLTAVPRLVSYSDDPSLDAQTHAWAFQALGDITEQRLPNDSAAWRSWYENNH